MTDSLLWVAGVAASLNLFVIFGFLLVERRQPAATMAWLLALLFMPLVGLLLYWLFGARRVVRQQKRSRRVAERVNRVLSKYRVAEKLPDADAVPISPETAQLLRLATRLGTLPASSGNRCDMLPSAAATYAAMFDAMEEAKDHVHMLFYIFQPDRTGKSFRDRLVARAKDGLKVRVLTDAVGSSRLDRDFWRPLLNVGGEAAEFKPVFAGISLRRRDRADFRNHRKIVVVDGHLGLTGGINVGREYLGLDPDVGYWRDSHVRIEGPAVLSLQQTFVEDWALATGEVIDDERYFPACPHPPGEAVVSIVDSGPDRPWAPLYHVYFQAMALAKKRLWITSPYFIPDHVMEETLVTAALRGVDVRILVPSKSDSPLVSLASRSYYPRLLDAGVRIFEYRRGFVHAKTLVVDDWLGTIGSANMDVRSFQLNFELNALIYDGDFARGLAGEFMADLDNARELERDWESRLGFAQRLLYGGARLLSPLL